MAFLWSELAQAYAFVGNSLLAPMSATGAAGLEPAFWRAFPAFGSAEVEEAAERLACFAERLRADAEAAGSDAVQACSVEYAHLFIGPPRPAAPPWETMYVGEGSSVGFGRPTAQMRELLSQAGLELRNENRQYEDHLGIELLYLSELCRKASDAEDDALAERAAVRAFVEEHPGAWVDAFGERVAATRPAGYFSHLVELLKALLAIARRG